MAVSEILGDDADFFELQFLGGVVAERIGHLRRGAEGVQHVRMRLARFEIDGRRRGRGDQRHLLLAHIVVHRQRLVGGERADRDVHLDRSTSSCSLVLASAGWPAVSCVINSTLRPAIMPLRSLRNSAAPSSCCLPPAASGPVSTVRKPIFSGSAVCASTAGAGKKRIAAPALSSVRRDNRGFCGSHGSFLPGSVSRRFPCGGKSAR